MREARQTARGLKPYELLSKLGKKNRIKKGAIAFQNVIQEKIQMTFHKDDHVLLHDIVLSVNDH